MRKKYLNLLGFKYILGIVLLAVFMAGFMSSAKASHFRYGHISWQAGTGNTIDFTVDQAWRNFTNPLSIIADTVNTGTLSFGDGNFASINLVITSVDPVNNWMFGRFQISHTYATTGTRTAFFTACCRISSCALWDPGNDHINNPDGNFRVQTTVNVGGSGGSSVSALPPIVVCPERGLCAFQVPGIDPDGGTLNYRLSTSTEASGSPSGFTQPGGASINSTGNYTWDTATNLPTLSTCGNTLYSTQVVIENLDSNNAVIDTSAVDFLIQLLPVVGDPPTFDSQVPCGTTVTANIGNTTTFTVSATDPDGDTVTLNVAGLPPSATMTPALPTSGTNPSSIFSWTPTAGEVGVYAMTFTATDTTGQQALCSITVRVFLENCTNGTDDDFDGLVDCDDPDCANHVNCANNAPDAVCQPVTVYLDASGNATITPEDVDNGSSDPDGDDITLSLDIDSFDCNDTEPVTVTLTVSDGGVPVSPTKFYWTDRNAGTVNSVNPDGSGGVVLASGFNRLQDVELDESTNTLYFAHWNVGLPFNDGTIEKIQTDGTGLATVLTGPDGFHGLALDQTNGIMYYTQAVGIAGHQVSKVNMDGTGNTMLYGGGWFPSGIDLDLTNNLLYWGDIGVLTTNHGAVNQMNTDGSGVVLALAAHVDGRGRSLALDAASNTIFISSHNIQSPSSGGEILAYDITNNALTSLIQDSDTGFWDIEIFGDRIYFADHGRGEIKSCKFDGSDLTVEVSGLTGIYGLDIEVGGAQALSDTCTAEVTVIDNLAPVLSGVPADVTVECDNVPDAASPTATDNCDTSPDIAFTETRSPDDGSSCYTLTRTWTATDDTGINQTVETQTITVVDTTDPTITCPADVTVECTGDTSPLATGSATGSDTCGGVSISSSDISVPGDCDNTETITRTWTATDDCGNIASCDQVIEVVDTTAPVLSDRPANVTVECDNVPAMAVITATDNCDGVVEVIGNVERTDGDCADSYMLTRTWTATDACGNSDTHTQTVTVQDTTPPTLSVTPSTTTLWPPNHKYVTVSVGITVSDNCDTGVADNVELISVTSDEPEDVAGKNNKQNGGDGNTLNDIEIVDNTTVQLRAERLGGSDGRVYTLNYRVEDDCGNTTTASTTVTVRHNPNRPAVDSGVQYTVTP